jgi:hypothetical protein
LGRTTLPAGLSTFLMNNYDATTSELVLPGRGRIAVSADSVHRVFGLPNGGDPVPYEFDSTADAFIDSPYGLTGKQVPTIQGAN